MALPQGRATFDRLVSASLPAALRFAVRLTGKLDVAEEIVQEAMLRATRSWKTYRGDSQFNTWLFGNDPYTGRTLRCASRLTG